MSVEHGDGTFDDGMAGRSAAPVVYRSFLVLALEGDRPLSGGARYLLDGVDRVTFGRGTERHASRRSEDGLVTLHIQLPGRSTSAAHARLSRMGRGGGAEAGWLLEDLESRNGTFVEDRRVTRELLGDGVVFELGHAFFFVKNGVACTPGTPTDLALDGTEPTGVSTLEPRLALDVAMLGRVATSNVPVLLHGETGTGKEVVAREFHALTGRRGAFVAVNCGALPASLVESSLFGHVKGAFSGAAQESLGLVRAAHGGTLFLDEVAELPKASQVALLRVLQERIVVPVGATEGKRVDLRLVAATHAPLDALVAQGEFRRDLFARLAGYTLTLPPLRERRSDVGVLVATLLRRLAGERASALRVASDAARALLRYDFPMNVRELEQALAMALTLVDGDTLELAHLPAAMRAPARSAAVDAPPEGGTTSALDARDDRIRRELIEHMATHEGNVTKVAAAMGKARMQVQRWCRRFGIEPGAFRK